jgi:hypothetical protein
MDCVCKLSPQSEDFKALRIAHPSQHVEPQHPPHKEKGDDTQYNVCHPLAGGFWFSKVKHRPIVAFVRPLISSDDGVPRPRMFVQF